MAKKNKQRGYWGDRQNRSDLRGAITAFQKYLDQLRQLSMCMFDWDFESIPVSERTFISARYLEYTEYYNGLTVFFKDEELGQYLILPCAVGGNFTFDDEPFTRRAYSPKNGYHKELTAENSVIIWNNYIRKPTAGVAEHYAQIMADLENAMIVNCKAQKTPIAIVCSEDERLSMLNAYNQYEGNTPFIFGEKGLNLGEIRAISTGAPFVAKDLYQIKMQMWNEALTHIGISNISYQKKERMVSDEVIRNMGGTIASRYSRLEMRREACKKINEMFGLDISVDYREDYRQTDDENIIRTESEGRQGEPDPLVVDLRTR